MARKTRNIFMQNLAHTSKFADLNKPYHVGIKIYKQKKNSNQFFQLYSSNVKQRDENL